MLIRPGAARFVLADRVQLLVGAEQTGGALSCFLGFTPSGTGPPLHRHEREDECFTVLEGAYEMACGARRERLGVGDTIFLPRRIPHTFVNVGPTPARLFEMVAPGGLEHYFDAVDPFGTDLTHGIERRAEIGRPFGITFPSRHDPAAPPDRRGQGGATVVRSAEMVPFDLGTLSARWTMPPDAGVGLAVAEVSLSVGAEERFAETRTAWLLLFVRAGTVEVESADGSVSVEPGACFLVRQTALLWRSSGATPARLLVGIVPAGPIDSSALYDELRPAKAG